MSLFEQYASMWETFDPEQEAFLCPSRFSHYGKWPKEMWKKRSSVCVQEDGVINRLVTNVKIQFRCGNVHDYMARSGDFRAADISNYIIMANYGFDKSVSNAM